NPGGTPYSAVATGLGNGSTLQAVFLGANDKQPHLIWQDPGGTWHHYGALPSPYAAGYVAIATGAGN
ncbi:hypothetical protein, partial [Klebsiella pneumoniae]|uniref:hypothetical protein n=1 Tax=Klebsiella pneumoniae TaxID=573 RepID=UPI003014116A